MGRTFRCLYHLACVVAYVLPNTLALADEAAWPERFGFGREASAQEIDAWNRDVRPDGEGLPSGSGSVSEGEAIYAAQCAVCHGRTGVEGPNDRLVRRPGEEFPRGDDPNSWQQRNIGNYWPYATTLFDYVWRSMPQNIPGSLSADEVYALTAYLLWLREHNDAVPVSVDRLQHLQTENARLRRTLAQLSLELDDVKRSRRFDTFDQPLAA